jgi:hypothetical protein
MSRGSQIHLLTALFTLVCIPLLASCAPPARPVENGSNPTEGSPAASAVPPPTAAPHATEAPRAENPGKTVSYTEFEQTFSFTYDSSLARGVEAVTVEAVSLSQNGPNYEAHPAFVQFSFLGYNQGRHDLLPSPPAAPRLAAFPTRYFQEYGPGDPTGFPRQLEDLQNLLETGADLAERCLQDRPAPGALHLPYLPWRNEAQVFCARPEYVEFNGGRGIRYLTAFSQGILPLVESSVSYTFQGLSEDGEIYFAGTFPVLTGIFPSEAHPPVEGQQPQNVTIAQLIELNSQSEDLFQPALGQLDALVKSLRVEK